MEGIPEDIHRDHYQKVTTQYWEKQAEWRAATGNNPNSSYNNAQQATGPKKPKFSSKEELKEKLAAHKARKAAGEIAPSNAPGSPMQVDNPSVSSNYSFF